MDNHPKEESLSRRQVKAKIHTPYRTWIYLALGDINAVREIVFQVIPLDVSSYVQELLPTQRC